MLTHIHFDKLWKDEKLLFPQTYEAALRELLLNEFTLDILNNVNNNSRSQEGNNHGNGQNILHIYYILYTTSLPNHSRQFISEEFLSHKYKH